MSEGIANATVSEVDVTPEMVEAGLEHLYCYNPDRGENAENTVSQIFRAMTFVSKSRHVGSSQANID